MRAAIVGGIIAIITLTAYGIVQAGRWAPAAVQARVETPAPVALEPAPAVATEAASAEATETAAEAPTADSADAPVELAASAPADTADAAPSAAPSGDTVADAALPAVASPPVAPAAATPAVAAAAPVAPPIAAPVAAPVRAAAAAPPAAAPAAPAPASKPMVVAQYQPAPIAPTIRPAGATPAAAVAAPAPAPVAAPQPVAAPAPAPAPLKAPDIVCNNPNAMKVSRVVEIDTTGGPGFGSQHFKTMDFLRDHEVVLTFDDGPWLNNTPAVLKALADQCLRATFFNIGKHASYYPEILKQVLAAGHTVGTHTWSHADLSKAKTPDDAKEEIEKGFSAVHYYAQGAGPIAPFFRFPDLRHPPEMLTYLGQRNIASFSTDIDSFDFKIHKPDQLVKSLIAKVNKQGKGIILMHDFQKGTAAALPEILAQLKAGGFKIVHMVPKEAVTTIPQYDEAMIKDQKLPTVSQRPTSSVVKTISEVPGEAKQ
jgi:peptidoglycan/xylan/chitin deacetylase (PgdA/CDA1 family)